MTAYELGMDAYEEGKAFSDNPYEPGTDERREWNDGYDYAESFNYF